MSETSDSLPPEAEKIIAAASKHIGKRLVALALTGIVGAASIAVTGYAQLEADRARYEEIHARLDRDIGDLKEGAHEADNDLGAIRDNVTAIKATVEQSRSDQRARLERIERTLDALAERRGRRR